MIGTLEAKTHFSRLLARAERGEEITITRHGKPVAKLVPVAPRPSPKEIVERILENRQGWKLEPGEWKELRYFGRR
jgi:prevent-host-death family protein